MSDLARIASAAIEVDRLRDRKAAAKRARNKIHCQRENRMIRGGSGDRFVEPCWKRFKLIPRHYDAPDAVRLPLDEQCKNCRRRYIRQRAYAQASRQLGAARGRLTRLVRRYRREG